MLYGTIKTSTVTDEDGSEETLIENYKDGKVVGQVRKVYEERHRVNNELEEAAAYHRFSKSYHQDPSMLDPSFRTEGKNSRKGYYYVVCTYTRLLH